MDSTRRTMALDQTGAESPPLLPASLEDRLVSLMGRAAGLTLAAVAAMVWISLISWSSQDPSLSRATGSQTHNLMGALGAITADLLIQALGLTVAVAMIPPTVAALELAAQGYIARFKRRAGLFLAGAVATAAAAAALPMLASWPLRQGYGGHVGDIAYHIAVNILARIEPSTAGALAGLISAALGFFLLGSCLGIERSDLSAAIRAPLRLGRAAGPGDAPAVRYIPRWLSVRRGAAPRMPQVVLHDEVPLAERVPPRWQEPVLDDPAPVAPVAAMHAEMFDQDTDHDSVSIARRFAPGQSEVGESGTRPPTAGLARSRAGPRPRAYQRPSLNLLKRPGGGRPAADVTQAVLRGTARLLEDTLADFGVKGEIKAIKPGPVVTLYELEPVRGTKSARVIALADDIARSMSASAVRVAVVPGRNVIGIEIPNVRREIVALREILDSDGYRHKGGELPLALGKDIGGAPVVVDLARMPHLLVAGTTGSGKSVGIHAMVLSLLFRHGPEDCRLLMIDPKMLELRVYDGIPHLLAPVITDPAQAVGALDWAVREMEERYKRMAQLGVRSIEVFNNRVRNALKRGEALGRTVQTGFDPRTGQPVYEEEHLDLAPMPYVVIVIDEFADLMSIAGKEVELSVQRLAQMARAAGMHLIMATQRPSVDIVTGVIKANLPARISFKVASKIDSRTILGEQGGEQLLGQGDMLLATGGVQPQRVHGAFVGEEEVEAVAATLAEQGTRYVEGLLVAPQPQASPRAAGRAEIDDLYERAVAVVLRDRRASVSYLQRRLSVGYNRAAELIERMEQDGIVSPPGHGGRRDVLGAEPQEP